MAAIRMFIRKFQREVLIDEDHPLALAEREAEASVTRLDGKPLERGDDGLVHGDELTLTDAQEDAAPPRTDAEQIAQLVADGFTEEEARYLLLPEKGDSTADPPHTHAATVDPGLAQDEE